MIELVIPARRKDLGGGLEVGRVLPFAARRMVGPFVFLDHMGPADFSPGEGVDVRPHPHIGLATVTYLFEGEILHHDNLGTVQPILPGEVNWMTAGRGIVHSERTRPELRSRGGTMEGLQAWVALPEEHEETAPVFAHYDAGALCAFEQPGMRGTLVAGTAYGLRSTVATLSPMFYVDLSLDDGRSLVLPSEHEERAAYVARGRVAAGGKSFASGNLIVFGPGDARVEAEDGPARLMLLGGASVGPRHIWWNFVSSSAERIEEAKRDWRAGRMTLPPSDAGEFIPLPEEPPAPKPTDPV